MRALDTMASFAAEKNSQIALKKFVVAGASKVMDLLYTLNSNIHITILYIIYVYFITMYVARLDHMDHWGS